MAIPSEDLKKAQADYHREWAAKNRDKLNAAQARFRAKHKAELSEQSKLRRLAFLSGMTEAEAKAFRAIEAARRVAYSRRLKDEVYAAYGGYECKCCGVTEATFLSIDHMNNDGAKQRKELHGKTPGYLYTYLRRNKFPAGYQVLCMNCQVGKHRNGGVCPHQVTRND